ncbi:MAG: hypothetical protein F4X94_09585 [Dehalococcoidia bacterium]|nr:hypothetical protein [Dehalococcoidia bacterium]
MTLDSQTAAETPPRVLSSQAKIIMDKVNALGTPLRDWDVEIEGLIQAIRANDFTSHGSDSDLFKHLYATLNSSLVRWFLQSPHPPMKKRVVESAPIPEVTPAQQRPFIKLVDQILEAKSADPDADTSELEESIDWLVYDLYDLTDEETAIVADYFWDGDMTQEEEDAAFVKMMEEASKEEGFVSREEIMAILRGEDEG